MDILRDRNNTNNVNNIFENNIFENNDEPFESGFNLSLRLF